MADALQGIPNSSPNAVAQARRADGVGRKSLWRKIASNGHLTPAFRAMIIGNKAHELVDLRLHMHRAKTSANVAMASGDAITEVAEEDTHVAFWKQGDKEMNTDENLLQRFTLRRQPLIEDALQQWWLAARRTEGAQTELGAAMGEILGKAGHRTVLMPVYKALLDEFDAEEAEKDIEDDWIKDCRGAQGLSRVGFFDSIFELADIWTESIGEKIYSEFLWRLLSHVTEMQDDSGSKRGWLNPEAGRFSEARGAGLSISYLPSSSVDRLDMFHAEKVGDDFGEPLVPLDNDFGSAPRVPSSRRRRAKVVKRRRRSAVTIQGRARGVQGRKTVAKRKQAICKLQAGARGRLARKEATARRGAVTKIQSAGRGHLGRQQARKRVEAILRLQAGTRSMRAHRLARIEVRAKIASIVGFGSGIKTGRGENPWTAATRDMLPMPAPVLPTREFAPKDIPVFSPCRAGVIVGRRQGAAEAYLNRHRLDASTHQGPNLKRSRLFDYTKKPSYTELARQNKEKLNAPKDRERQPFKARRLGRSSVDAVTELYGGYRAREGSRTRPKLVTELPIRFPVHHDQAVRFMQPGNLAEFKPPVPPEIKHRRIAAEITVACSLYNEVDEHLLPSRIEHIRKGMPTAQHSLAVPKLSAASAPVLIRSNGVQAGSDPAGARSRVGNGDASDGVGSSRKRAQGTRSRLTNGVSAPAILAHRKVAHRARPRQECSEPLLEDGENHAPRSLTPETSHAPPTTPVGPSLVQLAAHDEGVHSRSVVGHAETGRRSRMRVVPGGVVLPEIS